MKKKKTSLKLSALVFSALIAMNLSLSSTKVSHLQSSINDLECISNCQAEALDTNIVINPNSPGIIYDTMTDEEKAMLEYLNRVN